MGVMGILGVGVAAGVAAVRAGVAGFGMLASGAAGVTSRRRFAMGIGSGYGEVGAFGLDFGRFGAGQGALGAVAGGLYDVTSPQRIGLMSAGVTGGKGAVETAVELIRKIPQMLNGVEDGAIGTVAKSKGLLDILDLPTIVRLKNHPEEIEAQVKKFQGDKITLDMSAKATEAWSNFNAELERDGLKIETALGKSLVGLTPGLTHLSEEMVDVVGSLIKSDALKNGLRGAEAGLERLGGYLGSAKFKADEDRFLSGMKALEQSAPLIIGAGVAASVVGVGLLSGGLTGVVMGILKKNPGILAVVLADSFLRSKAQGIITGKDGREYLNPGPPLFGGGGGISGMHTGGPGAPGLTGTGNSSLRYYAGHGGDRPASPSGVVDESTGRMLPPSRTITPGSPQNMSDIPDLSGESTYPRKGQPLQDISGFIWHHTGSRGTPDDIIRTLNQRGLGVQYIMDRDGKIYHALPEGTRGAHILPSEINNLSNSNTEGMEVIAKDDSDVTTAQVAAAQKFATEFSKLHPGVQYFGHGEVNPHHKLATEGLTIAEAVRHGMAPVTTPSAPIEIPLTKRTLMNYAGGSIDLDAGVHNAALKRRGRNSGHILDHMAPPPPKPITLQDHTGGMVQFSIG
jgi:N-acetylmuramoyl-L-alanine amidase